MNYKNFKSLFFKFTIILFTLISCKNDNAIVNVIEVPEQSNAAKIAIAKLSTHFNPDGSLNTEENPIGNIIFDFGFEFIYPNTLSYNNNTQVIVENFQSLVNITINMTDSLFVNGIAFPFKVETFNDGAIQIKTINNESEFMQLLEMRRMTEGTDCDCTEVSDPVCVEVLDPNDTIVVVEFPNICYAACEGFTQGDTINCGYSTFLNSDFSDCFEFVYPFSIIDSNGNTLEINTFSDFENALYLNYNINFVYPFDIINGNTGHVESITNLKMLIDLIVNCVNSNCIDNCPTTGTPVCAEYAYNGQNLILAYQNSCLAECDGFTNSDYTDCTHTFDCFDNCPQDYKPVCIEVTLPNNLTVTYVYYNSCIAECEGFTSADFISCN